MPIYAYRCGACGHSRDVLQKLSDPLLTTCPVCGAEAFTKQVTAAGFQLKGSGWYVTDFRDNGAGKKAEAKAEGVPEAKGEAAAAADAKPESKTESKPDSSAAPAGAPAAAPAAAASAPAPAPSPSPSSPPSA
ncbi:MAG: FmdB family zinc ribbon protein [Rubrivivax sp.]